MNLNKKLKLSFQELSQDLEMINNRGQSGISGGYDPGTDCYFRVLASMTGLDTQFLINMFDGSGSYSTSSDGVNYAEMNSFSSNFFNVKSFDFNNNSGAVNGNVMVTYSTGDGVGHAVQLAYIDKERGTAIAYDRQNGTDVILNLKQITYCAELTPCN